MTTFKELCQGKMWRAVDAMLSGLKEFDQSDRFKVKMETYGCTDGAGMCFGCAATCAIQKITGVVFTPASILGTRQRATQTDVLESDLDYFENAIDNLRHGFIEYLVGYFSKGDELFATGKFETLQAIENNLPLLLDSDWRHNLAPYEKLLTFLKENDL